MSMIVKAVGTTLAAAALLIGAGSASASAATTTAHHATTQAVRAQVGYTDSFRVHVGDLPTGTHLVATNVSSDTAGALQSGPASGTELGAGTTHDYEVVWFLGQDTKVRVTYRLFRRGTDGADIDTGKRVDLVFDVGAENSSTLEVGDQNGLVATRPATGRQQVDLVVC